jgi:hypothetical protein
MSKAFKPKMSDSSQDVKIGLKEEFGLKHNLKSENGDLHNKQVEGFQKRSNKYPQGKIPKKIVECSHCGAPYSSKLIARHARECCKLKKDFNLYKN